MFRTVPMEKLQTIVLARDERAVLQGLGELGAVQLTHTAWGPDTTPPVVAERFEDINRYDRIRSRVQELRKSLEILSPSGEPGRTAETTLDLAEKDIHSLERQSAELLSHRQRIVQRQKELGGISDQISHYRGFGIPLTGLDQFSFLHFVTGSLPVQNFDSLRREIGDAAALFPLTQQKGQQTLFAIAGCQRWPAVESLLEQAGFQREMLPVIEGGTADGLSEETERERQQLTAELDQLDHELRTLATGSAPSLEEIEGFADMEYRLLDASRRFSRTETTVLITGWVPTDKTAAVKGHIEDITSGRCVLQTEVPEASTQEQVPVLLKHSRLLRPFEMLVSTYGLPNYEELEPTIFVALSYIVMFGMMFGDAGHGMILALCGLAALIAGRSRQLRDFGILLVFGGSSSIIFGVVYGSYFGVEALKRYALWHDPLEGNPMGLMYGAIGIGIAVISLGLILNVINRFKRGDVIGGILDKFGLVGLLFYWGTLVFLINAAAIRSLGLMGVSIVLFFVVPIVGWAVKEPLEHLLKHGGEDKAGSGLVASLMESCVGAFEAILSYLANTISFVRLAAYAMSHAALLFAAFMLAEQVRGIPFGGSIWSLIVIILGNIVAIVLEGIIASVQALRLEYYEFFGKFFSGDGQPFEPFRLSSNGRDVKTK